MVNSYLNKYPAIRCMIESIKNGLFAELDEEIIVQVLQVFANIPLQNIISTEPSGEVSCMMFILQ